MADIELTGISFSDPQQTGVPFPVEVSVENNETVAPLYGSPALCSNGMLAPDGHRVEVTLRVRGARTGDVVWSDTKEVCATVEQPSNVLGDTTATFNPRVGEKGAYSVEADAVVPHAGGEASAQPKTLHVEGVEDEPLPTGEEDADADYQYTPIFDGIGPDSSNDAQDTSENTDPTGSNPFDLGVDPQLLLWVVLGIAALYAFGQGFDIDLGNRGGAGA